MPGGNVCEENLEQRIERIRKRDEEIENWHREAEADRLAALQANAMVKTKAPVDDDDWPKAHKYDTLDFTYDIKSENADADEKKSTDEPRLLRPFKKFPEGQGPPADPTYNFLAEPERDGKLPANNTTSDSKNWRANSNNSNNSASSNNRRNNSNNNSFNRGRNGANKSKASDGKFDGKKKSSDEQSIVRKNDRERNNDPKLQRQKSSDGMWRHNDDKDTKNNIPSSPTKKGSSNFRSDAATSRTPIQQRIGQSKTEPEGLSQKLSDLSIEKRGNITVSVTKDGEVKSVKLETARAIGTGRVGGGAIMRQHIHPHQQQQQLQQQQQQKPQTQPQQFVASSPAVLNPNMNTPMNYPTIDQFVAPNQQQQFQHQQPQFQSTAVPQVQVASPMSMPVPAQKPMSNVINGVPFKLPSVQDRLIKNRVFFDENLKNVDQSSNGKAVAGNQ